MRVLMTCGGTAGHVNPAIAIANTIKEREPDAEIAFVCSTVANDIAPKLISRAGYEKTYKVNICGMHKIWNPKNIKTLYLMAKSSGEAKKIIEKFKPDIIIGTGGFACYPVLNTGAKMNIPTIVHESNAFAGKAVKRLATKVDVVMTSFDEVREQLSPKANIIKVGNPTIKDAKKNVSAEDTNEGYSKCLLSFGGSRGAMMLNYGVVDMIEALADKHGDTLFYHASGSLYIDEMREMFKARGLDRKPNVRLCEYIYDMDTRMKNATVVLSRSGAMTISELALNKKAAILVPSPNVANNHQYKNAKALHDKNAVIMIEEKSFGTGALTDAADKLLSDSELRESLSRNICDFAIEDANTVIYEYIKKTLNK